MRSNLATCSGFTLLELLLVMAATLVMMAVAIPLTSGALDDVRSGMAARYLASRINDARTHAVSRSTAVALRFEPIGSDYCFGEFVDGNGNGVRTADIASGVDAGRTSRRCLTDLFAGVSFGLLRAAPDLDGERSMSQTDGVRIGTSRILTLGADGTATSGTLYIHGRRGQYAVRVLGATGRTRVLRLDRGTGQWISR
jgi:prepilin-type N-terminal cleavage/methylation domain-containing protein